MDINFLESSIQPAMRRSLEGFHSPNDGRIGFWADVVEVHADVNRVDVIQDTGMVIYGLPVISLKWVTPGDDYVSGGRNLPPVKSHVFCMQPTETVTSAFVLCSGYAAGETTTHTLYADDNNKDEYARIKELVSEGGWNEKEFYDNGNITKKSHDEAISLILGLAADDDNKIEKGIKLEAFGNTIVINEDGLVITDVNKNKFTLAKSGVEIEDVNSNKITMGTSGVSINGNLEVAI